MDVRAVQHRNECLREARNQQSFMHQMFADLPCARQGSGLAGGGYAGLLSSRGPQKSTRHG